MTIEEAIEETSKLITKYADNLLNYDEPAEDPFKERQGILEILLAHEITLIKLLKEDEPLVSINFPEDEDVTK